ncbi:MAG: magnesium protoporphyrin IX methyltransferase [Litoreibacter sp.]|nr:magnesium protoporphyrin IX methyltransferase [Litoreibacter sp.]
MSDAQDIRLTPPYAEPQAPPGALGSGYHATLDRVEDYFDRTATQTWERLTSDAPVSGIRATVRAGRERMRGVFLYQLTEDLTGLRSLHAGCGTGALSTEMARLGAEVVGVDISPQLIDIAQRRKPKDLKGSISYVAGDMLDPALGVFDHIVAMDSLIYYSAKDIGRILDKIEPRLRKTMVFTVAPRTPMLMAMWKAGKLFPRADRSPTMIPHSPRKIAEATQSGAVNTLERVTSGFYISQALEFRP